MLVTNTGGLWHEGKADWKREARKRGIARPKMVHFFHVAFVREKLQLIKDKDLWFVDEEGSCIASQTNAAVNWPLWN